MRKLGNDGPFFCARGVGVPGGPGTRVSRKINIFRNEEACERSGDLLPRKMMLFSEETPVVAQKVAVEIFARIMCVVAGVCFGG